MQKLPEGTIKCLDKGFVRLVDYMGDDAAIVQAARVSYGKGTKKKSEDRGLIRYLMRNRHTSPLEMVEFKFHCKMPIFVARQWVRHRTASLNEYSGRYSEMPEECYIPTLERLQEQSANNKQGSGEQLEEACWMHGVMEEEQQAVFENYHSYINDNLSRELARINLPLSTYTQWYWKIDLHNLFHFLGLRLDKHAQYEIRVFAEAIFELIKPIVPISCEAFEDYRLGSVTFSKQEIDLVLSALHREGKKDLLKYLEEDGLDSLPKRELAEFKQKLDIV